MGINYVFCAFLAFHTLFLSLVSAQLSIMQYPSKGAVAGQSYTIIYFPKDQTPTDIVLLRGPSTNVVQVAILGTVTGGEFVWTVPSNLTHDPNYSLQVRRGLSVYTFSPQFAVTGDSIASVSSPSSSTQMTSLTASPTSTTNVEAKSSNGGLGTAAKAAIIAVSIAAVLLALGAFLVGRSIRRRSKSKQKLRSDNASGNGKPELEGSGKSELDARSAAKHGKELPATSAQVTELEGKSKCFEMDARSTRSAREMDVASVRSHKPASHAQNVV